MSPDVLKDTSRDMRDGKRSISLFDQRRSASKILGNTTALVVALTLLLKGLLRSRSKRIVPILAQGLGVQDFACIPP